MCWWCGVGKERGVGGAEKYWERCGEVCWGVGKVRGVEKFGGAVRKCVGSWKCVGKVWESVLGCGEELGKVRENVLGCGGCKGRCGKVIGEV